MERFEVRPLVQSAFPAWIGMDTELRFASTGLATATLVVLLVCATREGLAQPGTAAGGAAVAGTTAALASTTGTSVAAEALPAVDGSMIRSVRELDALLAVRGGRGPATARQTDEAIAAAVARGHLKELEKKKPFRKQNNDLLRSQRAVQFGNQEMLLRLRLRAKSRNAMSVELRF